MRRIIVCIALILMPGALHAQETFHVFPQFADGRFTDGTYYRSTLMITPWFATDAPNCAFVLYGMATTFESGVSGGSFNIVIPAGSFIASRTTGTQAHQGGYGTLTCNQYVFAQVLYSFYAPNGVKLSEATVFSSNPDFESTMILDNRDGARLGLAIANNTDIQRTYTLTLTGTFGTRTATVNVAARRSLPRFVDELITNVSWGAWTSENTRE